MFFPPTRIFLCAQKWSSWVGNLAVVRLWLILCPISFLLSFCSGFPRFCFRINTCRTPSRGNLQQSGHYYQATFGVKDRQMLKRLLSPYKHAEAKSVATKSREAAEWSYRIRRERPKVWNIPDFSCTMEKSSLLDMWTLAGVWPCSPGTLVVSSKKKIITRRRRRV